VQKKAKQSWGDAPVKLVALMLADDLEGVAQSQQELQKMTDTIQAYTCEWPSKLSPFTCVAAVFAPPSPTKESPEVSIGTDKL
jgi:hypothetical protein